MRTVETIWTTVGRVFKRSWGSEQVMDMSVTNMPPHMKLAHVPARIERKIIRGRRRGRRFEATFEDKFTFADGTVQFLRDTAVLDKDIDDLVDMPQAEVVEGLNAILRDGASMERFHPGKRLNASSSDER